MNIKTYIEEHLVDENKIHNDSNYIFVEDAFNHRILVKCSDELLGSASPVIRFINPELKDLFADDLLHAAYFLPSDIEKDILKDNSIDPVLNCFLPEKEQVNIKQQSNKEEIVEIKPSDRGSCCTSFFLYQLDNASKVNKIVNQLIKEIRYLKDFEPLTGEIPEGLGILEKSANPRVKKPATFHVSFWGLSEKSIFFELKNHFTKLIQEEEK